MNKKWLILIIPVIMIVVGTLSYRNKQGKPVKQEYHDAIVNKILTNYPELQNNYDEAISDGVLTNIEAKTIIDMANNIKESKD